MKSIMDSPGIVPDQPIHQLTIELIRILFQQLIAEIHKVLLNSLVESLHVSVHLGSPGIGVIVSQVQFPQFFGKVLFEF